MCPAPKGKNKIRKLKCLYTNANSLSNKRSELQGRINQHDPDIIGITEVWEKTEYVLQGYHKAFRKDRAEGRVGGGVMLLVKENLNVIECKELWDHEFEEAVWCLIKTSRHEQLLVGVCYRSPSSTQSNNKKLIDLLKGMGQINHSSVLLMGDFNYGDINWELCDVDGPADSDSALFLETTLDIFLHQNVTDPTRYREGHRPSRLDLVFTDDENNIDEIVNNQPLGKSDHTVLTWTYQLKSADVSEKGYDEKLNFHKGNYESMNLNLSDVDWDVLEDMGVEEMWLYIKNILHKLIGSHVPKRKKISRKSGTPWWKRKLTNQVKRKYRAWKAYCESNSTEDYKKYKIQRNKTTSAIREARHKYENNIVKNMKKEPKTLYKYIRSQQRVKDGIPPLVSEHGFTETDQEASEVLQKFFQSVFVQEGNTVHPEFSDQVNQEDIIDNFDITPEAVRQELESLNVNKAAGPDGIPNIVLKQCATQLTQPLVKLFRKSLQTGTLPLDWKNAEIIPIYKKGQRSLPSNYRPVSLTSQVCKVMERIVKKVLVNHLNTHDLISEHQHGFTSRKSCQSNLLESLEQWSRILDEGKALDVLYLDYQKAFDSVPHKRLVKKLHCYGVRGKILNWIESFLHGRRQQVSVGGGHSGWGDVTSGVPQGSVLGPILFVIFINELPSRVQSNIKMFADDTKISLPISCTQDAQILQDDIHKLEDWSKEWLLKFNPTKCKVMHCGKGNPKAKYFMEGEDGRACEVEETVVEKDLGVHVSSTLKPTFHCQKAAKKGMAALRLLRSSFDRFDTTNFKPLFTTYVRPHLEYCIQAVGPYMVQDFKALEKVQRRASKLVKEIKHLPYKQRLKKLKMMSIEERVLRGDLIETYKILTGKVKVNPDQFFELSHEERTRGHKLKLSKRRAAHFSRLKFFSNRVVAPWNKLPLEVIEARTTQGFKNSLDKCWTTIFPS